MIAHLKAAFFGLAMGGALTLIGFTDWGEVHEMFTFTDLRMFLAFAGSVMLSMVAYWVLKGRGDLPVTKWHPGVIPGGVLFGAGWALTGACPSIAMAQLGQGKWAAIFTLVGVLIGVFVFRIVRRRWIRWDQGNCGI